MIKKSSFVRNGPVDSRPFQRHSSRPLVNDPAPSTVAPSIEPTPEPDPAPAPKATAKKSAAKK